MFKKIFFQAITASILASSAAFIYRRIYFFATEVDFSKVLGVGRMIGFNLLICLVMAFVNYGLIRWLKYKGQIFFNFIFSIFSFTAVIIPISITLPLNITFPELFPGLAVPMVLFPAIAWYTVNPLFAYYKPGKKQI